MSIEESERITTSQDVISRLHDKIDEQHARIAELDAQLEAIGAGGVEPLRKQAAAQQAVQAAVPATNHSETPNSSTIIVPYGWKLVPDGATPDWVANLEALPDWREAVGECIKRFLAAAPAHPAEGVPAQAVPEIDERAAFDDFFRKRNRLHPDTDTTFRSDAAEPWKYWKARAALAATQPAAQVLDAQTIEHISALSELVRLQNAEHFADAHNAAVRHLRALAAQAKQGGAA